MKRILLGFLVVFCFSLTACGKPVTETTKQISVIASNFPLYDFARQIGGDKIKVKLLLAPGVESHSFEPTPQDIIAIQNSDLFLSIGGESEAWVSNLLEVSPNTNSLALLDSVTPLEEDHEGHDHDEHEHDEAEQAQDEHIWTSPKNAILMANTICEALCQIDPQNKSTYQTNLAAYQEQLMVLDETFQEIVATSSRKELVFGDRFPFRYFTEEYGLSYEAAFPSCAAKSEPSAAVMASLIDKVTKDHIPVIFYLELSNQSIANAISEATGAKKLLLHSCHNVSVQEFEDGATYLSLMTQNAQQLKEALH